MNESSKEPPKQPPEEQQLENKMFRLTPEAIRAFDLLKAEQGAWSGPRLMAEAIDLLLVRYGKEPVSRPIRQTVRRSRENPEPK